MLIRFWNFLSKREQNICVTATLFRLRKVESCLSLENVWMADVLYDSCWIWQQIYSCKVFSLYYWSRKRRLACGTVKFWPFLLSCIKNIGCLLIHFVLFQNYSVVLLFWGKMAGTQSSQIENVGLLAEIGMPFLPEKSVLLLSASQ